MYGERHDKSCWSDDEKRRTNFDVNVTGRTIEWNTQYSISLLADQLSKQCLPVVVSLSRSSESCISTSDYRSELRICWPPSLIRYSVFVSSPTPCVLLWSSDVWRCGGKQYPSDLCAMITYLPSNFPLYIACDVGLKYLCSLNYLMSKPTWILFEKWLNTKSAVKRWLDHSSEHS